VQMPPPLPDDVPPRIPPALVPLPPVPGADKVVYLTFDDGPFPIWTRQILDVLARHNAKATFFVIGRQVPAFYDLIREASQNGMTFANHTYNHPSLAGISRDAFRREVLATSEVLGPYERKCLRPPYAHMDANTHIFAQELGYHIALWDIDPYDWQRPGAGVIAARVLQQISPGKVVLLHDGGGERSQTVAALEIILRTLSAEGYRFEPLCR
jgi:peptidoglycan-N-acetylglucosamine deacetylase